MVTLDTTSIVLDHPYEVNDFMNSVEDQEATYAAEAVQYPPLAGGWEIVQRFEDGSVCVGRPDRIPTMLLAAIDGKWKFIGTIPF